MDGMRRIRKLLILLFAFFIVGLFVLEGLNRTLLPGKLREWAEKASSQALGRQVSIGSVRLHFWHGFLLEKVAVAEDPLFGTEPFLEAGQVSGGILLLPVLSKKELLIPNLRLVRPKIRLIQNPDGLWNFQTFSLKKPSAPQTGKGFSLNVTRLAVVDGGIDLRVSRPANLPLLRVEGVNADVHLSLPAQVEGEATARVRTETAGTVHDIGRVQLEGRYLFQDRSLTVRSRSEWQLAALLPSLPENIRARVERLEGLALIEWETQGHLPLDQQELKKAFKGTLRFQDVKAGPAPYVGDLQNISGEVQFDAGGARTERVALKLSNGTPVELSGSISNDQNRTFGFRASTAFRAENPPPLPEELLTGIKNLKPSGGISIEAVGNGALLPQFSLRPSATARLEAVALEPPGSPRIEIRQGQLRWLQDLITFTGIEGTVLDQPLKLEGTLAKWEQPEINASFSWGKLNADAQVSLSSDKIDIGSFAGTFGKGTFRVIGQITRPGQEANLFGEGTLQAEDIKDAGPAVQAWLKQNPMEGPLAFRALLEGPLARLADCRLDLNLESPSFLAKGIPLQNLALHLRQKDRRITLESGKAKLAGGTLSASGFWDAANSPARWEAQLDLANAELAQLADALKWKTTTEFAGQVKLDWAGKGTAGDLAGITGPGNLHIQGARILEIPFLGKFGEFLGMANLQTIRFQEAQGPFLIKEGKISTEALVLRSPQATLTISGWGGFLQGVESPIKWRILPTFAPELIPEETRSKLGKAVAKGASYFIGEVQLSGTWKEPQRKFVSKKVTQILNEQIFNLQDLFQDIF